jgi:hypothetical protein
MRPLFLASVLLLAGPLLAQDTITVQTFTFDSITARRGTWVFPDTTHHYRKVLMLHTLKCSSLTQQDQYACGEWDYLTYHFIHEHTGVLDSTAMTHGYYRINAVEPDSTELVTTPMLDHHQRYSVFRTVDDTTSETDHALGVNDASDATTLDVPAGAARTQFIIGADELTGLTHVDAVRLVAQSAGSAMHRLTIRMKNTQDTLSSAFIDSGLTTVYDQPVQLTAGTNTLVLAQPFTWAGAGNNILVDLSVEERNGGTAPVLNATQTTHSVLHAQREGHVLFNDGRVGVDPSLFSALNDQITITFRAYGGASLPVQNSVLEAFDAQGQRLLNIHLPWSDGNVYWDAGNDGYDRISKAANTADYEGQWNYWAFTKNTATGSMKIYLNGTLWQSGTGKVKPMSGIASFNIGANGDAQNPYPGEIDDFNVFDTELSQATIQAWANKRVDATHPNYADLLAGLPFDDADTSFTVQNLASNGVPAHLLGHAQHIMTAATAINKGISSTTVRPDLTLVEAEYTSHLDSTVVTDDVVHPGVALETFQVEGNAAVPLDTLHGWEGGNATTYAPDGTVLNTEAVDGPYTVNHELDYFGVPFEVLKDHEIGRYITPYGINLSLGPNGFTWVYDVTDYQHLLHDSVDISAGNQQELLDLKFLMIEGVPPRRVVDVLEPWGPQHSYSYGDLSSNAELGAVTVGLSPQAHQWAMRSRITGHGDASSTQAQGCCEFKDNTHTLLANGSPVDSWHIWQTNDCALNPLYPQGGTWLYSREGWCPGDIVKERTTELTPYVSGNSLNVDYSITPVPSNNPGMAGGNYQMCMDLFEFDQPSHALDAEVYDVKRPSDDRYRSRENPMCFDPVVTLRNAGGTELTSVTFTYGVSGGTDESYTWTGDLKHMEMADVGLPISGGPFWTGDDNHTFHVSVSAPNGGTDEYADNDHYTTHFTLPVVYPDDVVLNYKTNNRPQDNTLTVQDVYGNTVFSRTSFTANTTYHDTLWTGPGCFTMKFEDSGNDGLSYWADPSQGNGFFYLRSLTGLLLKNFPTEFGRSIHFSFAVGAVSNVAEVAQKPGISVAPNPSDGRFSLKLENAVGPIDLMVYDAMGHLVRSLDPLMGADLELDLRELSDGPYTVRMVTADGVAIARLLKQ